jgi:hypothetical protein
MGGIVAAETLLLLANDESLPSLSSSKSATSNFASNTTLNSTTGTSHPKYEIKTNFSNSGTSSSPRTKNTNEDQNSRPPNPMFPHVVGLLAFDAPFLGISPGVIAHGAEGHYRTASGAYNAFSELSSAFGWGSSSPTSTSSPSSASKSTANSASTKSSQPQPAGLLANGNGVEDAAASPRWQSWGKYAMFAGAAGAVAAGGAAALYSQRDKLTSGWGWVSGHLEFVGCLLKAEELKGRVERVGGLAMGGESGEKEKRTGNGFGNGNGNCNGFGGSAVFYTVLGRGANTDASNTGTQILLKGAGEKRTFCKLPPFLDTATSKSSTQKSIKGTGDEREGLRWIPALNDKATDEITAHTSIFYPRENPGFYSLGERAKEVVSSWVMIDQAWYKSTSTPNKTAAGNMDGRKEGGKANVAGAGGHGTYKRASWQGKGKTFAEVGDDGWEKPDHDDDGFKTRLREKDRGTVMSEPVWVHGGDASDDDVRMRDGSVDAEDLESGSVVIDKAC